MRSVKKSAKLRPARLDPKSTPVIDEIKSNAKKAETRKKGKNAKYSFTRYRDDSVRQALEKIFHGKCAYCESRYAGTQPVDLEHFRPKSRVAEAPDFPGYWWLAADWDNLLPSCIDCNRSRNQHALSEVQLNNIRDGNLTKAIPRMLQGKGDAFPLFDESARATGPRGENPVAGESPMLLNPADPNYDFETYFRYQFNFAIRREHGVVLLPKQQELGSVNAGNTENREQVKRREQAALQTIMVCGLNRLTLRQARNRALVEVDFLINLYTKQSKITSEYKGEIEPDLEKQLDDQLKLIVKAIAFKMRPEISFSYMISCYLQDVLPGLNIIPPKFVLE